MSILLACLSVLFMHAWCPRRPEEDIGAPAAGTVDAC